MLFCFYQILFFLFDFLKIQRQSFYRFLTKGLSDEFLKRNPVIEKAQGSAFVFLAQHYKLLEPSLSARRCLLTAKTYNSRLIIPVHALRL
uniref:RNA polymerase b-subunit n=1 Tax=Pseudobryopsis hainanensis TaxID=2320808 RepID=A0A3S5X204_9CHLO|nr:RNA polymerase b-subunit [Pseudobryopsis hainanensis]